MPYSENGDNTRARRTAMMADLVVGATLWMRDPRQTPVRVMATDGATASFQVRVDAFEDAGAIWEFAIWEITKFCADPDAQQLSKDDTAWLSQNAERLNRTVSIECDAENAVQTSRQVVELSTSADGYLADVEDWPDLAHGLEADTVQAFVPVQSAFTHWMADRGLTDLEQAFTRSWSSNPYAGEFLTAHRMMLATLGLCPYAGPMLRSEAAFRAAHAKERRAAHIVSRLAFLRALFLRLGMSDLNLYRAVYSHDRITAPRNTGFLSATLREHVARDLFKAGQKTQQSALYWQKVPVSRCFATCLETADLSHPYDEAEVVLIWDPDAQLF